MDLVTASISRIVQPTELSKMVALNLRMLTTPWNLDVDAYAPLPGLGHTDRVCKPVQLFNASRARFLLIGGANSLELSYEKLNARTLRGMPYGLIRNKGVTSKAVTSHTLEQIRWVMRRVRQHQITSLAIFTSPYHLLRSYGTAIQALDHYGIGRIPIVPISIGSLDDVIPESVLHGRIQTGHDMVAGEVERFFNYSRKGDVADLDKIAEFMDWMRSAHPALSMVA